MAGKTEFTSEEARRIGDQIGVDWDNTKLEEFRMGLTVELEHGVRNSQTNVTDDDESATGKIALLKIGLTGLATKDPKNHRLTQGANLKLPYR